MHVVIRDLGVAVAGGDHDEAVSKRAPLLEGLGFLSDGGVGDLDEVRAARLVGAFFGDVGVSVAR